VVVIVGHVMRQEHDCADDQNNNYCGRDCCHLLGISALNLRDLLEDFDIDLNALLLPGALRGSYLLGKVIPEMTE
jgi:hypothetical protein